MIVIGLTGGMGSGKSTMMPWIEALGWSVLDADQLARDVLAPGQPGLAEVVHLLGPSVVDSQEVLQRALVANLVFSDPPLLRKFEAIVHHQIRIKKQTYLEQLADQNPEAKFVYIAPLLFETKMISQFQKTVLVALSETNQWNRLVEGRQMSEPDIKRRLAAQMALESKQKLADFVIDNNGSLQSTKAQVVALFTQLSTLEPWTLGQALGGS